MTFTEQMKENPMSWKDKLQLAISGCGLALALLTLVVGIGKLLEKQDATIAQVAALRTELQGVGTEVKTLGKEIVQQRGVDRLHDEQIAGLRRDVDAALKRSRP